jgi:hypothetical protein
MYFQPNRDELACRRSFEGLALEFARTHGELQKLIRQKEERAAEELKGQLDHLNVCVYALDSFMLDRINALRTDYQNKISKR